jgi:hypothetical protein
LEHAAPKFLITEKIVVGGGLNTDIRFYVLKETLPSCNSAPALAVTMYGGERLQSSREARRLAKCLNSLKNYLESANATKHHGVVLSAQTPLVVDPTLHSLMTGVQPPKVSDEEKQKDEQWMRTMGIGVYQPKTHFYQAPREFDE